MKNLIAISLLGLFAVGCASTPKEMLHADVEVGNKAVVMMQCKVLCDDNKVYAFTDNGIKCQCKAPVQQPQQVFRFELGKNANETAYKGVMSNLSNGKTLMSVVPQKGN